METKEHSFSENENIPLFRVFSEFAGGKDSLPDKVGHSYSKNQERFISCVLHRCEHKIHRGEGAAFCD